MIIGNNFDGDHDGPDSNREWDVEHNHWSRLSEARVCLRWANDM